MDKPHKKLDVWKLSMEWAGTVYRVNRTCRKIEIADDREEYFYSVRAEPVEAF
jgi:hypothetical protein